MGLAPSKSFSAGMRDENHSLALPSSRSAGFCYLVGAIIALLGVVALTSNVAGGVGLLVSAAFFFVSASVIQYIFDIRNLLVRQESKVDRIAHNA